MSLKDDLKDDAYFSKLGATQLKNLARHLDIEVKDIKCVGKYKSRLRKRIIENFKSEV